MIMNSFCLSMLHRFLRPVFLLTIFVPLSANALEIQEVDTNSGIQAFLVEDYTLPLISVSFAFKTGAVNDPVGREGTTRLMTGLLDEGAENYDSATFRAILEENAIEMSFRAGRERISGSLRLLRSDKDLAFDLLRLALTKPRFDAAPIERLRNAFRTSIQRASKSPRSQAAEALREALFGDHPYARSIRGTVESIDAIKREDIVAAHQELLARNVLSIGVVGAISASEVAEMIDSVFGDLPAKAKEMDVEDVEPALGEEISIEMPTPTATISLVYRGLKRKDPDYFAAFLMNHILGGGTFSSRLYEEVREKRGLAYGISSNIATLDHAAYLTAATSTRNRNSELAIDIMREEIARLAREGVTKEELEAAKKYVLGSYAINNLDTSTKIAQVLVAMQTEELGIDYLSKRETLIDAVTQEDVNAIAAKLLTVEPLEVIVMTPQAN